MLKEETTAAEVEISWQGDRAAGGSSSDFTTTLEVREISVWEIAGDSWDF
jgi:hypothetical protein